MKVGQIKYVCHKQLGQYHYQGHKQLVQYHYQGHQYRILVEMDRTVDLYMTRLRKT